MSNFDRDMVPIRLSIISKLLDGISFDLRGLSESEEIKGISERVMYLSEKLEKEFDLEKK